MIPKPEDKKKIEEKIKTFFQSAKWKNFLVFLVFVGLAFSFWLLQYFQQNLETEINMQVNYTHIPPDVVFTNKLPQEINIRVLDRGTNLLNYYFKKNIQPVTIDLENLSLTKSTYNVSQSTLYNLISEQLLPTSQLKSFSPEKIDIEYSPLAQKELPVVLDGTLMPAPGYMFSDSILIEPPFVTIYGEQANLDTLRLIKTIILNKRNINQNLDISVKLSIPEGTTLSSDRVKLNADIEEYTEKTFELPIICYNQPEDILVRFFPSNVELFVQVGLSKYPTITENDFEIGVDYNELIKNNIMNYPLTLTKKPQWLVNYRIVPDVVEFLVERKRDL